MAHINHTISFSYPLFSISNDVKRTVWKHAMPACHAMAGAGNREQSYSLYTEYDQEPTEVEKIAHTNLGGNKLHI